ncbi:MAG TPA: hypothetical protein VII70_03680 [Steroidobacteraceae bacterium]
MLDVHAPHGPTHSWRDFMAHIAAIAIGLLLALALEKIVEYVHERRELTEARRELVREVAGNRSSFAANVIEASRVQQELDADLRVIQAVRLHAPIGDGKFDYSVNFNATLDGPWQAIRQSGSLNLMPYEELQTYAWFHGILASVMESMHAFETTLYIGAAIAASAPPEKLNEHDLNELAGRTMEAQGRLANLRMFLGFEENGLANLSQQPGFKTPQ